MPRVNNGTPHISNSLIAAPYNRSSEPTSLTSIPMLDEDDHDEEELNELRDENSRLTELVQRMSQSRHDTYSERKQKHAVEMQQKDDKIKQLQEDIANMRQQLEYWRNVNKAASSGADTAANNQFNYKRLYYCHRTMEFLDRARKIL